MQAISGYYNHVYFGNVSKSGRAVCEPTNAQVKKHQTQQQQNALFMGYIFAVLVDEVTPYHPK